MLFAIVALSCLQSAQPSADAARVERLAGLCKLWGFAKYFHPWLAYKPINWDRALIEALPAVEAARDAASYSAALTTMLTELDDPWTRVVEDVGAPKFAAPRQLVSVDRQRGYGMIVAGDWGAVAADEDFFPNAFEQCARAESVVVDLRRGGALPAGEDDPIADRFAARVQTDFAVLLERAVEFGARRGIVRSGYPPCQGDSSGGYFARFESSDADRWEPRAPRRAWKRVVIVTDDGACRIAAMLDALQAAGIAAVVHAGHNAHHLLDGDSEVIALPLGVRVRVRTSEIVYSSGCVAFEPVSCVERFGWPEAAFEHALVLADARKPIPPPHFAAFGTAVIAAREEAYAEMSAPSREYRLLALFRLWNVLHRFFPYQQLMERSLDELLPEAIASFEAAGDALAYQRAVLEFTAQLRDSHVWVNGGYAAQLALAATHGPPIAVESWSAGCVVVQVLDEELEKSGSIARGDVVLAVDGHSVDQRRAELARFISSATPQALAWNTDHVLLLGGPADSRCVVKLRRLDGSEHELELKRTREAAELWAVRPRLYPSQRPFTVLPCGLGYFDLVQLEPAQVDEAFEAVRKTPGLILDMRGYPRGTAWAICARLTQEPFAMASFRRPQWNAGRSEALVFDQPIQPAGPWRYEAPIAVLIDNDAISQSEHSCLGFEGAARGRITFVGAPTMGSNGDVTNTVLPGNLYVSFSGHDVRHADGRQLQRVGIQPDVRVEPTIDGWLAGGDEVLDAAIALLSKTK